MMSPVDDGEREQDPAQRAASPQHPARGDEGGPDRDDDRRELDYGIEEADWRSAGPAATAQRKPAQDRNEIVCGELRAAARTAGTSGNNALTLRQALHQNAEKAADEEGENDYCRPSRRTVHAMH